MKICTKCKIKKNLSEFGKDSQKKDGLRSSCRQCKSNTDKQYRVSNKDKIAKSKRIYADKNKESIAIYKQQWHKNNIDRIRPMRRNSCHKRRELIKQSSLTGIEYSNWIKNQIKLCTYCGTLCNDSYHVDHIDPISNGGKHEIDNLTIACQKCNQSKSSKNLIYWLATKKELIEDKDKKPCR